MGSGCLGAWFAWVGRLVWFGLVCSGGRFVIRDALMAGRRRGLKLGGGWGE